MSLKNIDWNALSKEAYLIAKDAGWYEEQVPLISKIALMHAEISEASHEDDDLYYVDGKPEGRAIEVSDCIIYILSYAGSKNLDINDLMQMNRFYHSDSWPDLIVRAHSFLSQVTEECRKPDNEHAADCRLINFIPFLAHMIVSTGVKKSLEDIIKIKIAFNKTREYRHGNKIV